ncbi:MAG TPA: hypothetical protein PK225_11645, partial [Azonexus sp.]|nr:hypothetical protein [Azonexus sp.]
MSERSPLPAGPLAAAGLNRQHVFDLAALPAEITATLGATAGFRQLILLGHGGKRLWECDQAAGGAGGGHPHAAGRRRAGGGAGLLGRLAT